MPHRTADVATNSPRFRRKSSTFVDAIHDLPATGELAPAQLYSTESGRLFHSGRIAIASVGLPARGKTWVRSTTCLEIQLTYVETITDISLLPWHATSDGTSAISTSGCRTSAPKLTLD